VPPQENSKITAKLLIHLERQPVWGVEVSNSGGLTRKAIWVARKAELLMRKAIWAAGRALALASRDLSGNPEAGIVADRALRAVGLFRNEVGAFYLRANVEKLAEGGCFRLGANIRTVVIGLPLSNRRARKREHFEKPLRTVGRRVIPRALQKPVWAATQRVHTMDRDVAKMSRGQDPWAHRCRAQERRDVQRGVQSASALRQSLDSCICT
jgi:hypothetical protein